MESPLELTLASDIRMVAIQLQSALSFLRQESQAGSQMALALVAKAEADLGKLAGQVQTWTSEIRSERRDRRASSAKAVVNRILRPQKPRR